MIGDTAPSLDERVVRRVNVLGPSDPLGRSVLQRLELLVVFKDEAHLVGFRVREVREDAGQADVLGADVVVQDVRELVARWPPRPNDRASPGVRTNHTGQLLALGRATPMFPSG